MESNTGVIGPDSNLSFTAAIINVGDGVPATATYSSPRKWSIGTTTSLTGGRLTFASVLDFSTRQYLSFIATSETWNIDANLDDLANGGLRVIFVDGSGNYAGYNLYGGDSCLMGFFPGHADRMAHGAFGSYQNPQELGSCEWIIDRAYRIPDYVSGTIDWSDIVATEWVIKPGASSDFSCQPSFFGTMDVTVSTGTVSLDDIAQEVSHDTAGWKFKNHFSRALGKLRAIGEYFNSKIGFQIGDGATATTWTDTNVICGFWDLVEDITDYPWAMSHVQLGTTPRLLDIYQSATCSATLTDCTFRGSSRWAWVLRGNTSGTLTATRCAFKGCDYFTAAHGTYTDCSWVDSGLITITTATDVTDGSVRDGAGIALGAAADFSALTIEFSGNSQDVTLTPTAPGTYNLGGLSKASAITIHNASATHAITVQIAAGQTSSTTTAGGVVTVQTAPSTVAVNGLVTGSIVKVIRNDTSAVIFTGSETAGAVSFSTSYTGAVTVEARKASAAPYYRPWSTVGTVGAGITFTATQALDQ